MGPVFSIAFLVLGSRIISARATVRAAPPRLRSDRGNWSVGLGWIVAELHEKIQAAGSLYDYVTDGLGAEWAVLPGAVLHRHPRPGAGILR